MKRRLRWLDHSVFAGVLLLVMLLPAVVLAGQSRFADVSDGNPFLNDIEWLADAGVTLGCNPPTNGMYCPTGYVTRQQMAAFLHRSAGYFDGDDDGTVDNAEMVAGYAPSDLSAAYAIRSSEYIEDFVAYGEIDTMFELDIEPPADGLCRRARNRSLRRGVKTRGADPVAGSRPCLAATAQQPDAGVELRRSPGRAG